MEFLFKSTVCRKRHLRGFPVKIKYARLRTLGRGDGAHLHTLTTQHCARLRTLNPGLCARFEPRVWGRLRTRSPNFFGPLRLLKLRHGHASENRIGHDHHSHHIQFEIVRNGPYRQISGPMPRNQWDPRTRATRANTMRVMIYTATPNAWVELGRGGGRGPEFCETPRWAVQQGSRWIPVVQQTQGAPTILFVKCKALQPRGGMQARRHRC